MFDDIYETLPTSLAEVGPERTPASKPNRAGSMLRELDLKIEYVAPDALTVSATNPRKHSKRQQVKLEESIKRFGFVVPVLVDAHNQVVAGALRVAAARKLGMRSVPAVRISHLTELEQRALVIADNRLAELSEWDRDLLAIEVELILSADIELATTIGFEDAEIDILIGEAKDKAEEQGPEDALPDVDSDGRFVSEPGDLWKLGNHRLFCGDARSEESYRALLEGKRVDLVFSDPPYNVRIAGHVSGLGKVQHGEFAFASGEMPQPEFVAFLAGSMKLAKEHSRDGAIHYVCMDAAHGFELLSAARQVGLELKTTCVWAKTNGGMGSLYRQQCEFVHVFKVGSAPHVNNVELGRHGRNRTTLWSYAGVNTFRSGRMDELAMHPTVKPVALVADAIKDCSKHKAIVLDPFCGSGTTLIAAEKTGRRGYGIEYEPKYVDAAIRRWQAYTGRTAVHAESGLTFEEMQDHRRGLLSSIGVGASSACEGVKS